MSGRRDLFAPDRALQARMAAALLAAGVSAGVVDPPAARAPARQLDHIERALHARGRDES
jgi:hypothetical protein